MLGLTDRLKRNQAESLRERPTTPSTPTTPSAVAAFKDRKAFKNACILPIARIVPDPNQPRKTFADEPIGRLAQSLTAVGQLVPLIVRYDATMDMFVILDGERRFRAATLAALPELACVVDSEANRDTILEIQLVVNALREDVNPMEQARAWQRLAESRKLSLRDLAVMLNYDHTVIGRKISLLGLPEEIQTAIEAKEISQEMGISLAQVEDPAEQAELAERVKAGDVTRDEMRQRVAKRKPAGRGTASRTKGKPKVRTTWPYKEQGGWRITVERAKGIEPGPLLEALERFAEKVRAEMSQAG